MTEFGTRAVHAGLDPDPSYGSVVPAIHQSSTYVQPAPGEFVEDYDYSRAANPTRRALENALGELEGGHASAFASGMAATHALLTAVCSAGDHVVIPDDLYGGTYRLVDKILARFGVAYDMVDQTDLGAVRAALRPETKLVWVETPTNPTLKVIDLLAVIDAVGPDVLVAVDNTFGTPVYQRPLECGAGAVVHSTTKYLGGHSDAVGGRGRRVRSRRCTRPSASRSSRSAPCPGRSTASSSTAACARCTCGWPRTRENGAAVSAFLRDQPGVSDVRWPGFSGMVCFRHPEAVRIVAATKLFALAESLGGVESLIEVPQAMTHQSVEDSSAAVPADLVRVSCGIEAAVDLVEDLRQAIAAVTPAGVGG